MQVTSLPIADIRVPEVRRTLRHVDELARSIAEVGLLQPILVTPKYTLIAGYHRLEACRSLGWTEIPAIVDDNPGEESLRWQLAEIDENLIRNELTVLERGEELSRRKVVYEKLHPTAPTGPGRPEKNAEIISAFTTDTAEKVGVTDRTVRQELQIATKIDPEVKKAIRDTPVADSKTDLLALARMKPAEQAVVVERLKSAPTKSVKDLARRVKHEDRIRATTEW